MNELKSLESQNWSLNLWKIFTWFMEMLSNFKKDLSLDVLAILNDPNEKLDKFFSIIYSWKFPEMLDRSRELEERFFVKHSNAFNEWCMKIQDLTSNNKHLEFIQKLYESKMVSYWSNYDDFSFYQIETVYKWRKLRIMFYNSSDRKTRKKLSFNELLEKNEPVRICWY